VSIQDVDKSLAESFGLDKPKGALIAEMEADGPAERGGLQAGDIIVKFNGQEILESSDLPHVVGLAAPGSDARVLVIRNRKSKQLTVTIGSLADDESPTLASSVNGNMQGGRLGLVVQKLDQEMRDRSGIKYGVIVSKVVPEGVAAKAGIQSGDIITSIDSTIINSLANYEQVVSGLKARTSVPVRIIRRGRPVFIGIKITE